jgi:hypothetical protein
MNISENDVFGRQISNQCFNLFKLLVLQTNTDQRCHTLRTKAGASTVYLQGPYRKVIG